MRLRVVLAASLCSVFSVSGLSAQFVQYTTPGDFQGPAESREQSFERAMREARWKFGRLLVDPWIGIRNAGYQDNLTQTDESGEARPERVSDLTVSFGAGINTYLPIGSDLTWGTFILPEYVWWQDSTERRRFNGRYGTGLFANFGRIGFETLVSSSEQSQIATIEIEEPLNQRSNRATLDLTVDLGKGLLFFGKGVSSETRSLEDEPAFQALGRLDRDESVYGAGIGFLSQRGLRFGIGFEESETDTLNASNSSEGSAIVFDAQYDAPLFKLSLDIADRSIDPKANSSFVPFSGTTTSVNLRSRAVGPVWFDVFARRNLALSLQETVSRIEDEVLGAGLRTSLGSKVSLRAFVEEGELIYVEQDRSVVNRIDDVRSYGVSLRLALGRFAAVFNGRRSEYDSNFMENNRTLTQISTSITLAGIGGGSSPWGG